ncbi:MAG: hypothetical protein ABI912_10185 [Actinomycetota bacterium]
MTIADSGSGPAKSRRLVVVTNGVSRRTIGKAMIAVGVAGILIGLMTAFAGQSLAHQVERSGDDRLRLTAEALATVSDSVTATQSIVESVRTGMTSIRTTMTTVETSLADTSTALTQGGTLLGSSLPKALEAVNGVLPTIESIAGSVDSTLRLLDRVPFGPSYQPVEPFDQAIGRLSTALKPLPDELRTLGASFDNMTGQSKAMSADVARLGGDLETLNAKLVNVGTLLDRYATAATNAKELAQSSRRDLSRSTNLTKWWLGLLGLIFALGQIVPIWLGAVLLSGADVRAIVATPGGREKSISSL